MKISIITVLNTINYGSVLQTFATQKYLESLGMEVEFVDYIREDQQFTYMIKKIVFDKKTNIKKWLKKPIHQQKMKNYLVRLTGRKFIPLD